MGRFPHISAHVIVPPALKGRSCVVRVAAVNLDQLVQHAPSQPQVLVSQMFAHDEEDLAW
jgi:hypothetical protein